MIRQKTITEMVRDLRERADEYEKTYLPGLGSSEAYVFSVRTTIKKLRDDADYLEAALKLELEKCAHDANKS